MCIRVGSRSLLAHLFELCVVSMVVAVAIVVSDGGVSFEIEGLNGNACAVLAAFLKPKICFPIGSGFCMMRSCLYPVTTRRQYVNHILRRVIIADQRRYTRHHVRLEDPPVAVPRPPAAEKPWERRWQ